MQESQNGLKLWLEGEFSSGIEECLNRLVLFSTPPFNVNAVILVNPAAVAEATALDEERHAITHAVLARHTHFGNATGALMLFTDNGRH